MYVRFRTEPIPENYRPQKYTVSAREISKTRDSNLATTVEAFLRLLSDCRWK